MIEVTENGDKTFTIRWDENDPQESIFNTYTEEDFINLIQNYLKSLQESGEVDINQVTEAVNHINDHIEEEIINTCEETFGKECYPGAEHEDYYNWYSVKEEAIKEYLESESEGKEYKDFDEQYEAFLYEHSPEAQGSWNQNNEQSKDRTVSPPRNFPYFP